jgi:ABC-type molybdate transport system substrate-binding protein
MKSPYKHAEAIALCLATMLVAGCETTTEKKSLVIYHHGSPSPAIEAAQKVFEAKHPDTKVLREKGDALPNMRKVTHLGLTIPGSAIFCS